MPDSKPKLTFDVAATRIGQHGSIATCKAASIRLDTDLAGNPDVFNPAELAPKREEARHRLQVAFARPPKQQECRAVTAHAAGSRALKVIEV